MPSVEHLDTLLKLDEQAKSMTVQLSPLNSIAGNAISPTNPVQTLDALYQRAGELEKELVIFYTSNSALLKEAVVKKSCLHIAFLESLQSRANRFVGSILSQALLDTLSQIALQIQFKFSSAAKQNNNSAEELNELLSSFSTLKKNAQNIQKIVHNFFVNQLNIYKSNLSFSSQAGALTQTQLSHKIIKKCEDISTVLTNSMYNLDCEKISNIFLSLDKIKEYSAQLEQECYKYVKQGVEEITSDIPPPEPSPPLTSDPLANLKSLAHRVAEASLELPSDHYIDD